MVYNRRLPLHELDARIEVNIANITLSVMHYCNLFFSLFVLKAVNANVIKAIGMKYIYDKCPVVAGVGAIEQLPDYNRTRGRMWWARF